jgi:FkbM family methyltransferase
MPDNLQEHVDFTREQFKDPYHKNIMAFLRKQGIKTFIDAGGCTGEVSLMLLESIPTITAGIILEPILENYEFIKTYVTDPRIIVINKALYETEDTLSIGRMDDNQNVGGYSLLWNRNTHLVECVKLEALCNEPIDFIKMDIEGAELNVIENSNALRNIKYLELEFHNNMPTFDGWISYLKTYLPNHKLLYNTNNPVIRNAFLVLEETNGA